MKLKVKKLNPSAKLPAYQTKGASGFDLASVANLILYPGETRVVPTGLAVAVPGGHELQVRPRSGLSLKSKVRVANAPGTVDSDFRGEIGLILTNTGSDAFEIKEGDRLAQGVVTPVIQVTFEEVEDLDATERGTGAYGSTGKSNKKDEE